VHVNYSIIVVVPFYVFTIVLDDTCPSLMLGLLFVL
jgi:hypothetical protein